MLGVFVNTIAVLFGSLVGLLAHKGLPQRFSGAIMTGIGLCTMFMGISGALQGENPIILVVSIVLGAASGTALKLDRRLNSLGEMIEKRFSRMQAAAGGSVKISNSAAVGDGTAACAAAGDSTAACAAVGDSTAACTAAGDSTAACTAAGDSTAACTAAGTADTVGGTDAKPSIAQGFVSASLLFCVGAMAIIGSINSGLTGDHSVTFVKSTLDMIAAAMLAVSLGVGVVFSAASVLVYQGMLVLLAQLLRPLLDNPSMLAEMNCTGSVIIIGLGFNILGVTKIKVADYLPAIVFAPIICAIAQRM